MSANAGRLSEVPRTIEPATQMIVSVEWLARIAELAESIDKRLAALEAKFDEYEPLIAMVKERAERGSWRARFGTGGNP